MLKADRVECAGIVPRIGIPTTLKIRVLVQTQQIVRLDREQACPLTSREIRALRRSITSGLITADAVIIADYAKGVITEPLISEIKQICRERGVWLSCDPKPAHVVDISGFSLLAPNRKEAFELAGIPEPPHIKTPSKAFA